MYSTTGILTTLLQVGSNLRRVHPPSSGKWVQEAYLSLKALEVGPAIFPVQWDTFFAYGNLRSVAAQDPVVILVGAASLDSR